MTIADKKALPDIENIEFNNDAEAKNVVLFGKTTDGSFLPFLVDTDGSII